jgi:MerR family transcriptional regulator, light-induced transcriptional regulator
MLQKNNKPIYPLRYVTEETGVKADTLRAWERRYGLPNPSRSAGGQRLFSDKDIETIQWLLMQKKSGMSISHAVNLWNDKQEKNQFPVAPPVEELMDTSGNASKGNENQVLADAKLEWIRACFEFNEFKAEQVLTQGFSLFPMEIVCTEILRAGLSEVGTLWYRGKASIQQEHFATQLAIRRINTLITSAPTPLHNETILIACPEGENHTFSALLLTLLLRYRAWNVVYLGANVPISQIEKMGEAIQPDLVIMIAMRLITAANLLKSAQIITQMDLGFAFGGWVFSNTPNIEQNFPGSFLGESLVESIPMIENLLSKPIENITYDDSNKFSNLLVLYGSRKNKIEVDVLDELRAMSGFDKFIEYLQQANDHLSQDMIAALTLGDITLVEQNMIWVERLLGHRNIPNHIFKRYLAAYRDSIQRHLGAGGDPIIEWMSDLIKD